MTGSESLEAKFARLAETVSDLASAIADLKTSQLSAFDLFDRRMHEMEDVRIRALEDWRLAEKIREQERDKQADRDAIASQQVITRRQFWIGLAVTGAVAIVAALIAGHTF